MFYERDKSDIAELGISLENIKQQYHTFKTGFPDLRVIRHASIKDGISRFSIKESVFYKTFLKNKIKEGISISKFVPASGAGSRMFEFLFRFLTESNSSIDTVDIDDFPGLRMFFENIKRFAFYEKLKNTYSSIHHKDINPQSVEDYVKIIKVLLLKDGGLGYGYFPKGLIPFYKYEMREITPIEDHLIEGANYATDARGVSKIIFTVSPNHLNSFRSSIDSLRNYYEPIFKIKYDITFSTQKESTNTICVDEKDMILRDPEGRIVFRPSGHGALLENLNDIDSDIIYIKNIDNLPRNSAKLISFKWKKILGGLLLFLQEKAHYYLNALDSHSVSDDIIDDIANFLEKKLYVQINKESLSYDDRKDLFRKKLNRPIRVCGMIKQSKQVGGGPFWVEHEDGSSSLQILEDPQIVNVNKKITKQSSYFNPVDIVCGIKDYKKKPFNLKYYRNSSMGFIVKKSKDGIPLRALELPGLWNGSMYDWNTVFVEVPEETFNPTKTISDLIQ